jgi:hypothetical protein
MRRIMEDFERTVAANLQQELYWIRMSGVPPEHDRLPPDIRTAHGREWSPGGSDANHAVGVETALVVVRSARAFLEVPEF